MSDVPRRIDHTRLTAAEKLIHEAVQAVEEMGADERLTDAVVKLGEARESVADYVDNMVYRAAPEPTVEPEGEELLELLEDLWRNGYTHGFRDDEWRPGDAVRLHGARLELDAVLTRLATRPPSEAMRGAPMAGPTAASATAESATILGVPGGSLAR